MREQLDIFHRFLGNCRSVAHYLGYTLRGYMKIRRKILNDQPLLPRVEDLLRLKAEQLSSEFQNNTQGVASVTKHINTGPSNGQVEFDKALKRIKSMFQAGNNRKAIHAKLTEAGRLTISYPRFCVLVTKANESESFVPTVVGMTSGKTSTRSAPSTRTGRNGQPTKRPPTR